LMLGLLMPEDVRRSFMTPFLADFGVTQALRRPDYLESAWQSAVA
jgi:hypothetical protein